MSDEQLYHFTAEDLTMPSLNNGAPLMPAGPLAVRAFDDTAPESVAATFGCPPDAKRLRITATLAARPRQAMPDDFEARFALQFDATSVINVQDPEAVRAALWIASDPYAALAAHAPDLLDPITFKAGQGGFVYHTLGPYEVDAPPATGRPQQLFLTRVPYGLKAGDVDVANLTIKVVAL
jgi:hypothetical protein